MWRLCSQFFNSGIHDAINKCVLNASRSFAIIPKYINLLCDGIRIVLTRDQIGSEQTVSRESFNYAREVKAADMSNL